ncbi:MAG: 3-oxoacyl-ACP synthase [Sphingomonadales bacterium]|nr:MAG: 3-oxoacyl-ACP synthase [Sphingomonadales bacterium]
MTPFKIVGCGQYLPRQIRTSRELDAVFAQPAGWTEDKFGIRQRHVADRDETSSMMGAAAARDALAMAGWEDGDFDALIGACGVMEQPIPGTSVLIQNSLGLGKSGVWAFDVNQTCLSFVTALDVVAMGMDSGRFKRALIVASDIASAGLDLKDPQTAAIFGDGAAAVCIEKTSDKDGPGLLSRRFETYGEGKDLATLRAGGTRIRAEDGYEALLDGSRFRMDAFGIFKAAARALPRMIDEVLAEAGLTRETVDLVICHQASHPGVEHVRRLMGGDPERVVDCFGRLGNQIAASLPNVLVEAHAGGRVKPGGSVLLLGTAAGISAAAMVLRT